MSGHPATEPHHTRRWAGLLTVTVVAVLVLAGALLLLRRPSTVVAPGLPPGTRTFQIADRSHVTGPVSYPQRPPAGGRHASVWLNCGIYDQPVPDENAVHSLEHGAVWITYQPSLPATQVQVLQDLVRAQWKAPQGYLVLSPYPGQPAPVIVTAWANQLALPDATDTRLGEFVRHFLATPSAPEPGAPCSGGLGGPTRG